MQNFKHFTEAKMTKAHFQLVADVIASLDVSKTIKKVVAEKFADAFEDTNTLFKRALFIKATKGPGYTRQGDTEVGTGRGNRPE